MINEIKFGMDVFSFPHMSPISEQSSFDQCDLIEMLLSFDIFFPSFPKGLFHYEVKIIVCVIYAALLDFITFCTIRDRFRLMVLLGSWKPKACQNTLQA